MSEQNEQNEQNELDHVGHAENVGTAKNVISAEHVGLVKHLSITGAGRTTILKLTRDIMFALIVVIALLIGYVQSKENLETLKDTQERLICSGRFQDDVDADQTTLMATIGELVVIITQIVPGPEREEAVVDKVVELSAASEHARLSINSKITYNNNGRPLPCPISETVETPP